jgi:hypothetical protein
MADRSDQEMRDLQATSVPVLEYRGPSGHERVGDVLVSAGSLLSWCAVWFYFRAAKAERRRERELGQDLA